MMTSRIAILLTSLVLPVAACTPAPPRPETTTGHTTGGFLNRNDNAFSSPRELWHEVIATHRLSGQTSKTDPRIENDGR